jgi:AAA domain, putative AbiEii toxin, Type IV TA system/AAA domain/Trypsin-like peptidase domain
MTEGLGGGHPASGTAQSGRVPLYLGRVLDRIGEPIGTCFQVAPGVLVTAWSLLGSVGVTTVDAGLWLDSLAGGERFRASVARVDQLHDLAVLTSDATLPTSAAALVATDRVALRTAVSVTGHSMVDDSAHRYRFLEAAGEWAGGSVRDDVLAVGRMIASGVVPGMSGAPVIRDSDSSVVGMVTGRYNSPDGWLADSVWVARTEDMAPLLADLAPAVLEEILGGASTQEPAAVHEPLPVTLRDTLASGNVLLVAGPEIPAARGELGRRSLLRWLVERTDNAAISSATRRQILASLDAGKLDLVARAMRGRPGDLERRIAEAYQAPPAAEAYYKLAQIPFTGVINMSWDGWLLDAFDIKSPVVIRGGSDNVLDAARTQEFAFTWFAGDPKLEQVAISSGELRSRLFANEMLSRFLTGCVQSSSLLFVGVRAADVADFFDALSAWGVGMSPAITTGQRRFAVCEIDELWDLNRALLRDEVGVELIGYNPADAGALATVIAELLDLSRPDTVRDSISGRPRGQVLSRVSLTNIGAFERLDLELGESWNVLLGVNGCGKTTLLRAVALGLCGDHTYALEAGEGLLRAGCDQGLIELQVGKLRFRTELQRMPDLVRVRTSSLSPVEQGSWAVLGFPALRGMSLTAPSGISYPQAGEPKVEDLLPLLRNQVDTRLDDIKQWIINIEARSRHRGDERARHMLDRFFAVLSELTPGITLEFESVDQASWEVWVRTDDGVVSIDRLSQGMNSIVAWVGTLLQRMYDIYPASDEPAAEPAFVLIDELDAHLHPMWQRLLPSLTRHRFPRVQFLATSHSPLVAGSLQQGELFVAERVPQMGADGTEHLVATVSQTDVEPEGLRADQILTSPLFGLMTSRSPEFGATVGRYGQLMTVAPRTVEEEDEMQRLKSVISVAYRDGETARERAAEASQDTDLDQALAEVKPSEQNMARLRRLADALSADGEPEET